MLRIFKLKIKKNDNFFYLLKLLTVFGLYGERETRIYFFFVLFSDIMMRDGAERTDFVCWHFLLAPRRSVARARAC